MENLTLDFNNFGSRAALGTYEKCDSLTLTIMLDEKDYAGYKFKIVAKKSDGHIIEQDIKELEINREEKTIKTELNNQFTTKEGVVKLEINMTKDGKEDTTKEAFFIVRDTINGEVVESTSIIPTLEGVKAFIDEAVISLGDLEQAGADIELINGEFKEAEIKRKANELLRERSEKERVRLESIRTTEEADRIRAEAERKEAENNRKVAESNRKLNENTRKTNEAARVEAELNRQSLFEENEEIRNENENLRIEAEKERKLTFSNNNKFESERVEAEKLRTIAEDKRVTAEKARVKAEEERVKAETRRESTYTDFNDSEAERKSNEANRVRAEAERVNAESGRNELFNTNEEKRNSTFIESERTRERAFNEAQSNRNEAYEESERVREEAFKVSEAARNEAEEGRVAEELLRVEAEKNRKVAESKRVETESARVENEKLRVSAETERVEAENLRVTAEEERVAAETKREEGFNKFEGKINANTEELKNARSATTGEKFDTLDERIDCEVDRLNKKIDVTMLQQEDRGSHVVENTVDGMTTDMIVKGSTLHNLVTDGNRTNVIDNAINTNSRIHNFKASYNLQRGKKYVGYLKIDNIENSKYGLRLYGLGFEASGAYYTIGDKAGIYKFTWNTSTAPESITEFHTLGIYLDSEDFVNGGKATFSDFMLFEEGADLTYIDEYFEGIKSFGQQEDKISILSSNKNLFNLNEIGKNFNYKEIENGFEISNTEDVTYPYANIKKYMFLKKGTYTFSYSGEGTGFVNVAIRSKVNSDSYSGDIKPNIPKTFTMDSDKEVVVTFYLQGNITTGTYKNKYTNIQLVEGSKSLNYEPYKCDKKDILLQNLGFDEGLRGLNNIVYDELNSIKNVAIKRVDKYIVTGEEDFTIDVRSDYMYCYFILEGSKPSAGLEAICNQFRYIDGLWNKDNPGVQGKEGFDLSGGSSLSFQLPISKLVSPNKDGVKKYFKSLNDGGKPVIVYYWLAEPIETPLGENINVKTFGERTYISFENSINGTSSFKAPVDAAATISRLNRENRALEEENAKLKAGTYKNAEDITITNEELQATQSAVDFLLFSNLNASESSVLYNGKKEGGGSVGAYLAMRIIKGKLKYDAVMKQYGEFKEDIDLILEAEGYGHLITQQ
ncbi:hypothetical protein VB566_00405 [Clostridium perfringens]|uniref:hypothetical protein n=1 Tax=Clostridium perfringens TaxID=1502 RepID=UPI002B1F4FAC|nr:hypothetical protein [Clostridium perfringens]MEA5269349.1 hypothetical protein [Clostridium perfringens]MEA5309348.1 hypothetical protein [Clostridium perfringens]MEA5339829.1 hypothetical protein [Clostridium perfringens]